MSLGSGEHRPKLLSLGPMEGSFIVLEGGIWLSVHSYISEHSVWILHRGSILVIPACDFLCPAEVGLGGWGVEKEARFNFIF